MLARVRAAEASSGQHVAMVCLTDYEDEAAYVFLKGLNEWPYGFFKMVNRAAKRALRRNGLRVETRTIRLNDYWEWLTAIGQRDDSNNRARFILEGFRK